MIHVRWNEYIYPLGMRHNGEPTIVSELLTFRPIHRCSGQGVQEARIVQSHDGLGGFTLYAPLDTPLGMGGKIEPIGWRQDLEFLYGDAHLWVSSLFAKRKQTRRPHMVRAQFHTFIPSKRGLGWEIYRHYSPVSWAARALQEVIDERESKAAMLRHYHPYAQQFPRGVRP